MRVIVLLIILLSACSGNSEREQRRELLRVPESLTQKSKATRANSLYDEKGNLLASEQSIAGLRLPRGLQLKRKADFRYFYETEVPADKLHWYFGARLYTAKITRMSGSTTYVAAKLSDGTGGANRFDVKITPNRTPKGKTRLEIRQLMPRKPTPPIPQMVKEIRGKRGFID